MSAGHHRPKPSVMPADPVAPRFGRRTFVRLATAATATVGLSLVPQIAEPLTAATRSTGNGSAKSTAKPKICVFSKPLVSMSFDDLAKEVSQAGFDGIEAPIRLGGHLDLNQIEDQLPNLVQALKQQNLEVTLFASDLNEATPSTERILKAAAANGLKRYRLKYFRYAAGKSIKQQLASWTGQLKELAALNQQLGLTGLYQNHTGRNHFGAALWDLADVLEQVDSRWLGIAYDIRHAKVEGGQSWPTTMRRVMPLSRMIYVKDFRWEPNGSLKNVPLGKGIIAPNFYQLAVKAGFSGPISLHEEYLSHKDPKLVPQHLAAMTRDLKVLQGWITSGKQ